MFRDTLLKLGKTNRLAKDNDFFVAETTGAGAIAPMMAEYRTTANFILVDGDVDGGFKTNKIGWSDARVFSVYIISRHEHDDAADRAKKLEVCRIIFKQMVARLIAMDFDNEMHDDPTEIDVEHITYHEIQQYSLHDTAGIFFTVKTVQPIELIDDGSNWTDEE